MSIRIVLADDHKIFLDGLRGLLEKQSDLDVLASVNDGLEVVKAAREKNPHIVIMDLSMPGMNGIEATRQITIKQPEVKVICLTMHSSEEFVSAAFEAGASSYMLKTCDFQEVLCAICAARKNQAYLCPAIASTVLREYRGTRVKARVSSLSKLTSREREVLQLIAEGHSTKRIAARLYVSVKTIGTHREHIMSKLGLDSVVGLTRYAIRNGLTWDDAGISSHSLTSEKSPVRKTAQAPRTDQ